MDSNSCSVSAGSGADTEPLAISKRDTFLKIGMTKLVQRWHYYGWLDIVRQGGRGRETMFAYPSVLRAYERFLAGEEPPLLPSEQRAKAHKLQRSGARIEASRPY
jgi:hypothetical protein